MTEQEQVALAQAAYHAWVVLGDIITDAKKLPRGLKPQIIAAYDLLTQALPPSLPKRAENAAGDGAPCAD